VVEICAIASYLRTVVLNDFRYGSPRFRDKGYEAAGPVVETLIKVADRQDCHPAQVALAWLLRHPGVVVIPGAKYAEQARTNAGAVDVTLNPEDERELDVRTEKFKYSALLARPFMG